MTRLFLSNTEYKIRNSLFIHQVDLFVCTSYVYHAWKKESQNVPLKLLVSTVNQQIFIMIQYTSSGHQKYLRFIWRKNGNPSTKSNYLNFRDTKFNVLESNIPYDSKAVSTEFDKKLNSYIKTAAEENNFKNQTLDQRLKQIYLWKAKGKTPVQF